MYLSAGLRTRKKRYELENYKEDEDFEVSSPPQSPANSSPVEEAEESDDGSGIETDYSAPPPQKIEDGGGRHSDESEEEVDSGQPEEVTEAAGHSKFLLDDMGLKPRAAAMHALDNLHGAEKAEQFATERRLRKISLLQQQVPKPPVPKGRGRRKIFKRDNEHLLDKGASSFADITLRESLDEEWKAGNIFKIETDPDPSDLNCVQTYYVQLEGLFSLPNCYMAGFRWILPIKPFNSDKDAFNLTAFDIDDTNPISYLSTDYFSFVCKCSRDYFQLKRLVNHVEF